MRIESHKILQSNPERDFLNCYIGENEYFLQLDEVMQFYDSFMIQQSRMNFRVHSSSS